MRTYMPTHTEGLHTFRDFFLVIVQIVGGVGVNKYFVCAYEEDNMGFSLKRRGWRIKKKQISPLYVMRVVACRIVEDIGICVKVL